MECEELHLKPIILKAEETHSMCVQNMRTESSGGGSGNDGVGIASVEQTETSYESGGVNIVKVTLTNGRAYTFEVRNGERGEQGADGINGRDGIDGVNGSDGYTPIKGVDYFDGVNGADGKDGVNGQDGHTPVITAVPTSDGLQILADGVVVGNILNGKNGDDATATPIEDSLDSERTDAALSAKQGKALKTMIDAIPQGGGDWEKLVDYTTTEGVTQVCFTTGDNEEVFDDYNELIVFCLLQPTDSTTRGLKVNLYERTAWNGKHGFIGSAIPINAPSSTEKSQYRIYHFRKTLYGIEQTIRISANNSSISMYLSLQGNDAVISNFRNNMVITPDAFGKDVFDNHFVCFSIGCYASNKAIAQDSRFIIYGKK